MEIINSNCNNDEIEIIFVNHVNCYDFEYNSETKQHEQLEMYIEKNFFMWKMRSLSWKLLNAFSYAGLLSNHSTYGATSQRLDYIEYNLNESVENSFINEDNKSTREISNEHSLHEYTNDKFIEESKDIMYGNNFLESIYFPSIDEQTDFLVELVDIKKLIDKYNHSNTIFYDMNNNNFIGLTTKQKIKYVAEKYTGDYFTKCHIVNKREEKIKLNKDNLSKKLKPCFKNKHFDEISWIFALYSAPDTISENKYVNIHFVNIIKKHIFNKNNLVETALDQESFVWRMTNLSWLILKYFSKHDLLNFYTNEGQRSQIRNYYEIDFNQSVKESKILDNNDLFDYFNSIDNNDDIVQEYKSIVINENKYLNDRKFKNYFDHNMFETIDDQINFLVEIYHIRKIL